MGQNISRKLHFGEQFWEMLQIENETNLKRH